MSLIVETAVSTLIFFLLIPRLEDVGSKARQVAAGLLGLDPGPAEIDVQQLGRQDGVGGGHPDPHVAPGMLSQERDRAGRESGWKIGVTGIGCWRILFRFQRNWVVFSPGNCTMHTLTLLFSWASSHMTDSVKPLTAC